MGESMKKIKGRKSPKSSKIGWVSTLRPSISMRSQLNQETMIALRPPKSSTGATRLPVDRKFLVIEGGCEQRWNTDRLGVSPAGCRLVPMPRAFQPVRLQKQIHIGRRLCARVCSRPCLTPPKDLCRETSQVSTRRTYRTNWNQCHSAQ